VRFRKSVVGIFPGYAIPGALHLGTAWTNWVSFGLIAVQQAIILALKTRRKENAPHSHQNVGELFRYKFRQLSALTFANAPSEVVSSVVSTE
jgi:hypothetical protein